MQTAPAMDLYDMALQRYPVPYESRFVETSLGATHVLLSGSVDSPPLVLLHGAGMNALAWLNQVGPFSRDFRVAAVDLPGQSGKSAVRRLPLTGYGTANWLLDVLNRLDFSRPHILGGSLGGWVALKFASAYPARLHKLALVAPGGIARVNWPPFLAYAPALLTKNAASAGGLIQKMAHKPVDPDVLAFLSRMVTSQPFRTAIAPVVISDAALRRVSAPTLIILGAGDQIFPARRVAPRAKSLLPDARIVTLDACGHLVPHDQPDAMMHEIMEFLQYQPK